MGDSVSLKYLAALNLFSPEFSPSLQRSLPLPLPPAPRSTIAAHPQVYKCRQSLALPEPRWILAVILLKFFFSILVYSGLYTMLVTIVSVQAPCSPPSTTPAPLWLSSPPLSAAAGGFEGRGGSLCTLLCASVKEGKSGDVWLF